MAMPSIKTKQKDENGAISIRISAILQQRNSVKSFYSEIERLMRRRSESQSRSKAKEQSQKQGKRAASQDRRDL